ncbi:MAG: sensor histidine kinase [Anaerolineae bacterium]
MADDLKTWLEEHTNALCVATLYRAPNMLPGVEDVTEFLTLLARNLEHSRYRQLEAVRGWALTGIGHDAHAATDWLTILHVLKEELSANLRQSFPADIAFRYWCQLDDLLMYAVAEASQLASDMDRAQMLKHMAELRRQMESFERSKSNFIAVAAHELKTPLTILEGYANMLRTETDPNSRLRLYVDGLENGFRRMREVINDMIEVSQIDLKSFELNYQRVRLERLVAALAENLYKYYLLRRVQLIITPFEDTLVTYADPEKMMNALSKVLMNALKYTPDGGRVVVRGVLTREDEAGGDLAGFADIQVQDSGIGIRLEELERIFERFTISTDVTLHSSSKTNFKGGGPGLGLPIAKGIVEAHGGRIWAESPGYDEEKCPGSTFHIEIPIWLNKPDAADREK